MPPRATCAFGQTVRRNLGRLLFARMAVSGNPGAARGGAGNPRRRGRSIVGWSPYPPCKNLRPAENPSTDGFCETVVSKGDGIGGACLKPSSEESQTFPPRPPPGIGRVVFRGGWGADGSPRSGRQTARQRRANSPEIGKNTPCRRSPAGSPTACPEADQPQAGREKHMVVQRQAAANGPVGRKERESDTGTGSSGIPTTAGGEGTASGGPTGFPCQRTWRMNFPHLSQSRRRLCPP